VLAIAGLLLLCALMDVSTHLLERYESFQEMVEFYWQTRPRVLVWLAVCLAAPVVEELAFRGWLLAGLARTRLGPVGAIAVTTLAWTALHLQYDWYGMLQVAALGIVLGIARLRTGSLWLCMAMHAVNNTIATVQIAWGTVPTG
jgi:membrane protease YdiL (CAAX protease family)